MKGGGGRAGDCGANGVKWEPQDYKARARASMPRNQMHIQPHASKQTLIHGPEKESGGKVQMRVR